VYNSYSSVLNIHIQEPYTCGEHIHAIDPANMARGGEPTLEVRTRGSSWEAMRPRSFGSGGRNAGKNAREAILSIITGGGKWVEITVPADSLYQHLLLTSEKKFWRCVESGEPPRLFFAAEPPRSRIEAVRIVDMSGSNSWAEFAAIFRTTRQAYIEHEKARSELKSLVPDDAKEAVGHGIRARRSRTGAVSFDLMDVDGAHAPVQ
jgi:hypothetical protein